MSITLLTPSNPFFFTKQAVSFSTTSSTYVTSLNLSGSGRIRLVKWSVPTANVVNVKVTIDGTVFYTWSSSSNSSYWGLIDGQIATGSMANAPVPDFNFKTSCLIEINVAGGATATMTVVYEN